MDAPANAWPSPSVTVASYEGIVLAATVVIHGLALSRVDEPGPSLPADAVLMELARAYRLAGNTGEARKTLQQVVEQHADSQYATEAKAELEKLKG